jgi:two-component system, chemotaxis family, CheB/CheR fusion protein
LRERSIELDDAKAFLKAVVGSIRMGLIVVDRDMCIVVWNRGCEQMWGLRSDETEGAPLQSLDIGLPLSDLRPMVGNALVDPAYSATANMAAIDRRGRTVNVQVLCTPFRGSDGSISGAMLLMEAAPERVDTDGDFGVSTERAGVSDSDHGRIDGRSG